MSYLSNGQRKALVVKRHPITAMRIREIILICILLYPLTSLGQDERDTIFRIDTIPIHRFNEAKQLVGVYESPSFRVFVEYKSLISSLKSHIKAYDLDEDKNLLKQLKDRSKTIMQRIDAIQSNPVFKSRLAFRTMNLMKAGKCIVLNRVSGANESYLIHQDYQKKWWTGTRFLTEDGHIVLDVTTGAF
jgi:hypothetical protein